MQAQNPRNELHTFWRRAEEMYWLEVCQPRSQADASHVVAELQDHSVTKSRLPDESPDQIPKQRHISSSSQRRNFAQTNEAKLIFFSGKIKTMFCVYYFI